MTGVTINDDGSGYAASEVITIVNANASGIKTIGNVGAADASRTEGTYTIGTSDYITQASGANATFSIVVDGSGAATITVQMMDLVSLLMRQSQFKILNLVWWWCCSYIRCNSNSW
ncbi:MAG: hypothetical protein CM15mV11_0760 [Caudoviricetes sp.]|nr:MAG: hypothetical protein CM15mV11_0760 [Caudoviricetes sp.]